MNTGNKKAVTVIYFSRKKWKAIFVSNLLSSDSKLNYSYILLAIKFHVNLAGLQF